MTPLTWLAALGTALAAWCVLAVVVALLVGGAVRNRDRQVPTDSKES